jgi:hypothetical protein
MSKEGKGHQRDGSYDVSSMVAFGENTLHILLFVSLERDSQVMLYLG